MLECYSLRDFGSPFSHEFTGYPYPPPTPPSQKKNPTTILKDLLFLPSAANTSVSILLQKHTHTTHTLVQMVFSKMPKECFNLIVLAILLRWQSGGRKPEKSKGWAEWSVVLPSDGIIILLNWNYFSFRYMCVHRTLRHPCHDLKNNPSVQAVQFLFLLSSFAVPPVVLLSLYCVSRKGDPSQSSRNEWIVTTLYQGRLEWNQSYLNDHYLGRHDPSIVFCTPSCAFSFRQKGLAFLFFSFLFAFLCCSVCI